MKKILLAAASMVVLQYGYAQKTSPLYETYFSQPDAMVQSEDGGYTFKVAGNLMVHMSDDGYYKLMDNQGTLLEEGDTDEGDDNFLRHGRWTEYYPSGKIKASGNYFNEKPYGQWMFYNEDGKLMEEFTIMAIVTEDNTVAYCKAGAEHIYHTNGNIKEERFYKAEPFDGEDRVKVEDLETGKSIWKKVKVKSFRPKPFGTWIYYTPEGKEERREDKKD